jgi:acyl dehydratase
MSDNKQERLVLPAAEIAQLAGEFEGKSAWYEISQTMIDQFADTIDDRQFIHVDPERAKAESPFGGTIAHGFLTLSMLSTMADDVVPRATDAAMAINYGFDKIRFLAPVPAGAKIRGIFRLASCEMRNPREMLLNYDVTIEIAGSDQPALVAEWYSMTVLRDENS